MPFGIVPIHGWPAAVALVHDAPTVPGAVWIDASVGLLSTQPLIFIALPPDVAPPGTDDPFDRRVWIVDTPPTDAGCGLAALRVPEDAPSPPAHPRVRFWVVSPAAALERAEAAAAAGVRLLCTAPPVEVGRVGWLDPADEPQSLPDFLANDRACPFGAPPALPAGGDGYA